LRRGNVPGIRRISIGTLVLAAIFVLSLDGLRPPSPAPASAPPGEFSATRAVEVLHRILGNDAPHPIGSSANEAVRVRIIDELTNLGYQPQLQTSFACSEYGNCATVNNVLARLDGTEPGDAVLVAAHYDSVPAGPGYSDDGTGAATVLEIARALKSAPVPRHSVIFLLDEGEEAGLLGARAFVDSHPWAKNVRAAVNIDNRGTWGPSRMFETGSANDWAVRLYAQHAARPEASSVSYTIYKLLPNDTDFTVFKEAGYQGLNFAYIGGVAHYHTPLDNSSNVSAASVQHHGENALPAVLALANADLTAPLQRDAVYFDLFGHSVIRWPARRTVPFALAALFLLLAQIAWMMRANRLALKEYLWGLLAWLVVIVVIGVAALVLQWLIRLAGALPVTWVAYPIPLQVAFGSLATAVVVTLSIFFTRRSGFWGLWSGVWTWWAVLSAVVAFETPGLGYGLLVPAGVAALAGLPATLLRRDNATASGLASILPAAAAGIVTFPLLFSLYSGLGNPALVSIALVFGFVLTPLSPLCNDLRGVSSLRGLAFSWIPILATVLAAFAAIVVPAYSAKAPERVNIEYWKDSDTEKSQWIVRPASARLPEPIRIAAAFRPASKGVFPWDKRAAFVTDAPTLDLAPPTFTVLESTQEGVRRVYRALLRSERGAPSAIVLFPPDADVEASRMEGQPLQRESPRVRQFVNGWIVYGCPAMPAGGVEITFSLPVGKSVEVSVMDQSYGLPAEGAFLLSARPLTATPSQDGDVTVVTRRVELLP
jgi:hypothetical protein